MRINGVWLSGEDGETRPIVPGLVRLTNDGWLVALLDPLIDEGSVARLSGGAPVQNRER